MNIEHKARKFLIPKYNELALFLMSVSILTLFILDAQLRYHFQEFISDDRYDPRIYLAALFFTLGIVYSIYHIFTHRSKGEWEKTCMLFFAVFVNAISGISAGLHVLEQDGINPLAIFPLWNLANGLLLIFMYRFEFIREETSIIDDNANFIQAAIGLMIVGVVIVISRHFFELHWSLTFSMCVAYSSNFDRLLQFALKGKQGA